MASVLGLLFGVALGALTAHSLRRQADAFLYRADVSHLIRGWMLRFGAVGAVLVLLMAWSVPTAIAALVGYWFGRTAYVVKMR